MMKKIIIVGSVLLMAGCAHPIKESYALERHKSDGSTSIESLDNAREVRILKLKEYKSGDRKIEEVFQLRNEQSK